MWAEFYSLSENKGITFEITQISICGDVFRIELPERPGHEKDERWFWVVKDEGDDFVVNGRSWSDFGAADRPAPCFERIDDPWSVTGLEPN